MLWTDTGSFLIGYLCRILMQGPDKVNEESAEGCAS